MNEEQPLAEDLEIKIGKLPNITNTYRVKNKQDDEVIYTGTFNSISVNNNLDVYGRVNIEKKTEKTIIKKSWRKENEAGIKTIVDWNIKLNYNPRLVYSGRLSTDYREGILTKGMKKYHLKISRKLFAEVFGPMEKELMEEYNRIKEF